MGWLGEMLGRVQARLLWGEVEEKGTLNSALAAEGSWKRLSCSASGFCFGRLLSTHLRLSGLHCMRRQLMVIRQGRVFFTISLFGAASPGTSR